MGEHTVHPLGYGFQVTGSTCTLGNPDVFPGLPGTCSFWEKYEPEPHGANNWNDTGNVGNLNNLNNTNNVNNTNNGTMDPVLAMAEADLVRIEGDLLYALSSHRGLLIVDLSDPGNLRILGEHSLGGTPFEMHLIDGVALVQYAQFWKYFLREDTGEGSFQIWSRLVALDVADPAAIRELGEFIVPGEIGDSRLIGDILYIVSGQTGGCEGCPVGNGISVLSLNVADPTAPFEVDRVELPYPSADATRKRSVLFTTSRIYVAGLPTGTTRSEIQVIDISNPEGTMRLGDRVEIDGHISNRWQMDESGGVLRVVGQSPEWLYEPVLTTFEIRSSDELFWLDSLTLDMQDHEALRSVRFDRDRAYIVTFQPVLFRDPLFIVDCSDPSNLVQKGDYELPGWIYAIEPRGDRLITFGFDNDEGGALFVSLFDVQDPWYPEELVRRRFGEATIMSADQSRIQKALQVLDDRGLILVPYGTTRSGIEQGAVHLFEFTADSLTELASVTLAGIARRALMQEDHLIVVGSEQIAAFDLADPAAPLPVDRLDLVHSVTAVEPVGDDLLAVLTENPWTGEAFLETYRITDTHFQTPLGAVKLTAAGVQLPASYQLYWNRYFDAPFLFSHDRVLHLLYRMTNPAPSGSSTQLASFDLTDPTAPVLRGVFDLPGRVEPTSARRQFHISIEAGQNAVHLAGFLAYFSPTGNNEASSLVLVDVRDPATPTTRQWMIPGYEGSWTNRGTLIISGDHIYSSYFTESVDRNWMDSKTREWIDYHLIDLDLTDPDHVIFDAGRRIPGSLVGVMPPGSALVTVDTRRVPRLRTTPDECASRNTYPVLDENTDTCWWIRHFLKISSFADPMNKLIREIPLGNSWIRDVQMTPTRLFYTTFDEPLYRGFPVTAPQGWFDRRPTLHAISLQDNPTWEPTAEVELPHPYSLLVGAHGDHAFVVADAPPLLIHLRNTQPGVFEPVSEMMLGGHLFDFDPTGDRVVFAFGTQGLRSMPLTP